MYNLVQNMETENRFELKFSMSSNGVSEFRAKYNLTKKLYTSRTITSYYFDTLSLKYFYKSVNTDINIPKYRIRYYNNDKKFTEEVKVHTELGRRKYSRQIDDTSMPTKVKFNNEILYPVSVVSYIRDYFLYENSRITIDYSINYRKPVNRAINKNQIHQKLNIIEFKSLNESNYDIFKDLPSSIESFSKFKDSISNLYHISYD